MLLDIENLTKTFPGVNNTSPVEVLKGLELKVEEGETTAIIGQSGSGKSTLLSLLAGLDQPTSGTLKLKERHLDSMSEEELTQFRAENIGIIFQQFHLMTHLNALENVSVYSVYSGSARKQRLQVFRLPSKIRKWRSTSFYQKVRQGN